jgi:hypothetical protein
MYREGGLGGVYFFYYLVLFYLYQTTFVRLTLININFWNLCCSPSQLHLVERGPARVVRWLSAQWLRAEWFWRTENNVLCSSFFYVFHTFFMCETSDSYAGFYSDIYSRKQKKQTQLCLYICMHVHGGSIYVANFFLNWQ